ncbi:MAG: metallophosphatase family protein, partial [Rhodospirillales bacterium]|nr:metallophosphatase family protein [Rhodospirillales bacterium]
AQHAAMAEWNEGVHDPGIGLKQFLRKPWLGFVLLHYWTTLPARARNFMRQHAPQAEYFVLGHTHRHGIWQRGQRTIINTGCFGFPGRPLAVVLEGNYLTVWRILQQRGVYRFARGPMRVFDLPMETVESEMPSAASPIQLDPARELVHSG